MFIYQLVLLLQYDTKQTKRISQIGEQLHTLLLSNTQNNHTMIKWVDPHKYVTTYNIQNNCTMQQ